MASNDLTPVTLRFLTDAGHLLATAAPETSAYMMNRRSDLMFEHHEMPVTDKQREKVCSCCGHIMRLGEGSRLQVKPEKRPATKRRFGNGSKDKAGKDSKSRRPQGHEQTPSGPTKAITCGLCARFTEIQLPAPAPISRRKVKIEKANKTAGVGASLSSTALEAPSQKATSNASSKKRAKSRKAGLQALLSQSSALRPGLGLSLADFMDKK